VDVDELLNNEEFFNVDCLVIGQSQPVAYTVTENRIVVDSHAICDETDLTSVFQKFAKTINGVTYAGGEAASHGSYGFFCRRTGKKLDWALMSTQSNPFVDVSVDEGDVRFVSSSGQVWIVENDRLSDVRIRCVA